MQHLWGDGVRARAGGRPSPDGDPPRCAKCGSLERHGALRRAFQLIARPILARRRALQFAPDASLEEDWSRSYEGSTFGGENSIDVQTIDRPDDSYDFISLSLVLEFVPDDSGAFTELLRIGLDDLILHITFASGLTDEESSHTDVPSGDFGTSTTTAGISTVVRDS